MEADEGGAYLRYKLTRIRHEWALKLWFWVCNVTQSNGQERAVYAGILPDGTIDNDCCNSKYTKAWVDLMENDPKQEPVLQGQYGFKFLSKAVLDTALSLNLLLHIGNNVYISMQEATYEQKLVCKFLNMIETGAADLERLLRQQTGTVLGKMREVVTHLSEGPYKCHDFAWRLFEDNRQRFEQVAEIIIAEWFKDDRALESNVLTVETPEQLDITRGFDEDISFFKTNMVDCLGRPVESHIGTTNRFRLKAKNGKYWINDGNDHLLDRKKLAEVIADVMLRKGSSECTCTLNKRKYLFRIPEGMLALMAKGSRLKEKINEFENCD